MTLQRIERKYFEYFAKSDAEFYGVQKEVEANKLLPENAAKLLFLKENLPRLGFNY